MSRWAWLLLLAACGPSSNTCERAADRAKALFQKLPGAADGAVPPPEELRKVIQTRCTNDSWSPAAHTCFGEARSVAEFSDCNTTLTKQQASALSSEIEKLETKAPQHSGSDPTPATADPRRTDPTRP